VVPAIDKGSLELPCSRLCTGSDRHREQTIKDGTTSGLIMIYGARGEADFKLGHGADADKTAVDAWHQDSLNFGMV
jgi:hypothetical protein